MLSQGMYYVVCSIKTIKPKRVFSIRAQSLFASKLVKRFAMIKK
jgi:hypothetical protein